MARSLIGFALLVLAMYGMLFSWQSGYRAATRDLAVNWFEGPEGYCLADNHPGDCK